MTLNDILTLTANKIQQGPFPLKKLLKESLYYPACDIDGELIRYCNLHFSKFGICSFVYADYQTGEDRLLEHLDEFLGYHLLAHRHLTPEDIGADKPLEMPEYINPEEYRRFQDEWHPFAHWAVLERNDEYGDDHGPKRFSLFFLGAEGVAAYEGLYNVNRITPKAIALIQPGHAFGFNWTNFFDWNAPLARTVCRGKSLPKYLFYGGLSYRYFNCPWEGYHQIDRKDHYYPTIIDSALTVWKGSTIFLQVYDTGDTLQILDNQSTRPRYYIEHVYVEYNGNRYEAKQRTYQQSDTLRGTTTIKELIHQNHWQPGQKLLCHFIEGWDMSHVYSIISPILI